VTGARVIVDSSKIPTYAMLLRGLPGVDLRVLHLVRDSRGVVFSWQKRVRRTDGADADGSDAGGDDEMFRYGAASASLRYAYYNGLTHALRAGRVPYRFLRYEDLLAAPERRVRDALAFAGRPAEESELGFLGDGHAELEPNHTVDGNPMRLQQGPVMLKVDDAWRREMGPVDRALVSALTAPLLAAYGYPLGRPRHGG